jgi:hypothetical protein
MSGADEGNSYSPTPSCGTWIWENKYTSFECDTVTFEVRVLSPLEQTLPARAPGSRTGGSAAAASRLVTRTISGVTVVSTISTAQSTTGTTSSSSNNSNSNVAPIAGGAVGGGIFLIAVVVGLWWFFCRKKRGQPKSTSVAEIDSNAIARNEMDANIDSKPKVYSEQQSRYQKDVAPAEMPTTSEMAELPGGSEAETWNNREVMEIRNMDPRGINFSRPVSRPAGHSR